MIPELATSYIQNLTHLEETDISILLTCNNVGYLPYDNTKSSGSSVTIPQNICSIISSLPYMAREIETMIIKFVDFRGEINEFKLRRSFIECAVNFLFHFFL